MTINDFLKQLKSDPETASFEMVIDLVNTDYHYTATRFSNGVEGDQVINEAGENEGSCKIFAFAKLNGLNEAQTLACFGHYYRDDVLGNPDGTDHANIRTFMRHGWSGVRFEHQALTQKS